LFVGVFAASILHEACADWNQLATQQATIIIQKWVQQKR